MNNEMRNELLLILDMATAKNEQDKKFNLEWLLERFENDIKDQLKELDYKKKELENNLNTLEYVRNELKKEGK